MTTLTLQVHLDGRWRAAAIVDVLEPSRGVASPCLLDYDVGYFADVAAEALAEGTEVSDLRALSVQVPVDMVYRRFARWPAFLLDLLPQGAARRLLAREAGFGDPDLPAVELPLLLRAAGSPIGNLRIREAWEQERERVARAAPCPGCDMETDILARSDAFLWVLEQYAAVASSSRGLQGEWPKVMMTRAADGLWYPDSIVADADAREYVIVKMPRARARADATILEAEAAYLEVARGFGLRVGLPLRYANGVLVIPRFDRAVTASGVVRYGQESLVSAISVAEFGYVGMHEQYLAVLKRAATDPAAEVTEYVMRDLHNCAMGNPDNHGRNAALRKLPDGTVALAPLYDFAPMRLDPECGHRMTRWTCMGHSDADPDWVRICEVAASGVMPAEELMAVVADKAGFLRALPDIARRHGISDAVIEQACRRHSDMADRVAALRLPTPRS